ncbi:hypothetical protein Bbelb_220530 [Branchiostoma belcheri]|nr:hypothetical protein Bbelb_220530 [Branchiostoma belcheri]
MAKNKTTLPLVQEHAKGEDIDVAKASSGRHQETDRKDKDVNVPEMRRGRQTCVPNIYTPAPTRGKSTQHVKEKVPSVPEKSNGGDSKNRSKAAPGICTNPEPGRQPSVPNIYTPAPTRGKNIKHVKEEVPSVPEKDRGKAAKGKDTYGQPIIKKETAVGPHGTAPGICTNPEPGRQPSVPNIYTPTPTRGENTQHVQEKVPSVPEKGNGGDSKMKSMTATSICTNSQPGHQPSVPNIYTPAPTRGKSTQHVKEEVPSVPEKSIGGDNKNRSKATHPGKHAYEQTIIGKEAAAGLYGTAAGIYSNPQPAEAEPKYLHVGDHVVMYSGQESGDAYGYSEAEGVDKGYKEESGSHNYDKPDGDVYGYEEPAEVSKGFEEGPSSLDYEKPENVSGGYKEPDDEHTYKGLEEEPSSLDYEKPEDVSGKYKEHEDAHTYEGFEKDHSSRNYDKPEDVYGYNDPKDVGFPYKAKACVVGIWNKWKSSKVCWLALGCGLLVVASVVISVILATQITNGGRMSLDAKPKDNGTMTLDMLKGSDNPWQMTFYMDDNSAFDDFKVVNSTPTYLPFTNSIVTTEALSTTVTSLSTTGLRCETGWSEYNSHCYILMRGKVVWKKAKLRCTEHGASLASIKDVDENSFITGLILNSPGGKIPAIWLGLHKQSGGWKWTDGSRLHYKNWAPGEPNARTLLKLLKAEDCVAMYSKTGKNWMFGKHRKAGQWNNDRCSSRQPFVCEKPI